MTTVCCNSGRRGTPAGRRWVGGALGMAVPCAGLALMPKCPACVAAYVALATGVGISTSAASYVRTGAILACVAALVVLGWRTFHGRAALRKARRRRSE